MRPLIVPCIAAACFGLFSCAKDGAAPRKNSVSIGRFGVTRVQGTAEAPATKFEEIPAGPTQAAPAVKPVVEGRKPAPEPSVPPPAAQGDDGARLPNMLGLPEDKDLKATGTTTKPSGDGVSSKPPVEKKD